MLELSGRESRQVKDRNISHEHNSLAKLCRLSSHSFVELLKSQNDRYGKPESGIGHKCFHLEEILRESSECTNGSFGKRLCLS